VGDQPISVPLPTQQSTESNGKHRYLKWDSNPLHQCSSGGGPRVFLITEVLMTTSMKMVWLSSVLVSRCQKAGQRQSIKIGNRSFESVAKFKSLGTTVTG
jgi:hypothetical protein